MTTPMALICKALFPSLPTFETPSEVKRRVGVTQGTPPCAVLHITDLDLAPSPHATGHNKHSHVHGRQASKVLPSLAIGRPFNAPLARGRARASHTPGRWRSHA